MYTYKKSSQKALKTINNVTLSHFLVSYDIFLKTVWNDT